MAFLEGDRLARQSRFYLAIHHPVDCDRKEKARGGAVGVLVAESCGNATVVELRVIREEGFRFYLRLRVLVDSLHPQPGHPSQAQKSAHGLSRVRQCL